MNFLKHLWLWICVLLVALKGGLREKEAGRNVRTDRS